MDTITSLQQRLVSYFASGMKPNKTIGGEFEHFVVCRDNLRSYNYYEKDGIRDLLVGLKGRGWKAHQPDHSLLSLDQPEATITLEPGGQLELSVFPQQTIGDVARIYRDFVRDVKSILKPEQALVSMGFHPTSRIEEIPFIPKARYKAMSEYFNNTGVLAHHMMKGTASTQVGIDYSSEADCGRKLRVFTVLAPLIAAYFDSSAKWQGETYGGHTLRTKIWSDTDPKRSGAPDNVFSLPWHFSDYADYVLSVPPILMQSGDHFFETGTQTLPEIATWLPENQGQGELSDALLEHALTMVFPDVRLKKFLEIRMTDALPYPYNFAVLDFVSAIAYNEDRLNTLHDITLKIGIEDLSRLREEIVQNGLGAGFLNATVGAFMDHIVDQILVEPENYPNLKAFSARVKELPGGYANYLKTLSPRELLKEVEVKL